MLIITTTQRSTLTSNPHDLWLVTSCLKITSSRQVLPRLLVCRSPTPLRVHARSAVTRVKVVLLIAVCLLGATVDILLLEAGDALLFCGFLLYGLDNRFVLVLRALHAWLYGRDIVISRFCAGQCWQQWTALFAFRPEYLGTAIFCFG